MSDKEIKKQLRKVIKDSDDHMCLDKYAHKTFAQALLMILDRTKKRTVNNDS